MLKKSLFPAIIIINREQALTLAVQVMFLIISIILSIWHVRKNLIKACKYYFEIEEIESNFYTIWNRLINYLSEDKYKNQL